MERSQGGVLKKQLRNKGFSLIEVILALGILGSTIYFFTVSSSFITKQTADIKRVMSYEKVAVSLYENIRRNIHIYQTTYDPSPFLGITDKVTLLEKLPLAWNDNGYMDVKDCPQCKGRTGFVISPIPGYRGLYRLVIRFVHETLIDTFIEYNFFISG